MAELPCADQQSPKPVQKTRGELEQGKIDGYNDDVVGEVCDHADGAIVFVGTVVILCAVLVVLVLIVVRVQVILIVVVVEVLFIAATASSAPTVFVG